MPIHVGEVATYYKDYERERESGGVTALKNVQLVLKGHKQTCSATAVFLAPLPIYKHQHLSLASFVFCVFRVS